MPTAIGLASSTTPSKRSTIAPLQHGLSGVVYWRFPSKKTMEQKPAPAEDHSFGRELKVGAYGLLMAAGLITIFLLIMSYLASIVHQHFGGSLPFFLDRG